jgi:hypothetical protein
MTDIRKTGWLVVALLAVLAGCSSTPNSQPAALANAAIDNPDEVTCKTIIKTGTRIGTRVCKTNRAWAMGNREGRNMAEDVQRRAYQSCGDPNCGGG